MNETELAFPEARKIVRRYAHDLSDVANRIHLESSLLIDDITNPEHLASLQKVGDQVTRLGLMIRSLTLRFSQPCLSLTPATDVFEGWRARVGNLTDQLPMVWEEPVSEALLNIDFNAILTVLIEICEFAYRRGQARPIAGGLSESADEVVFQVRETRTAAELERQKEDSQEIVEWRRLVEGAGGRLEAIADVAELRSLVRLSFPRATLSASTFS